MKDLKLGKLVTSNNIKLIENKKLNIKETGSEGAMQGSYGTRTSTKK